MSVNLNKKSFYPLVKDEILSRVSHELQEKIKISIHDSITSTNDFLKINLPNTAEIISICLAEHQSAGKGRCGKRWQSPHGMNIYFSAAWPCKNISKISGLSLAVSLAVVETLERLFNLNFKIKWPNDILWDEKKIAGILIEICSLQNTSCVVIIGIGINANMRTTDDVIDQPWTSLCNAVGSEVNRNEIIATLISILREYLVKFEYYGFEFFKTKWENYDYLRDKAIFLTNEISNSGIAMGVNESGQLLVKLDDNKIQAYYSGEISVRLSFC